jgi:uncharacterized protein (DUF433 family)
LGPLISESRVSVFDVMDAFDAGDSLYDICATFNLTPLQVETALAYIARHRAVLAPQLDQIRREQAAREEFYRSQASEVEQLVAEKPMTPRRAAIMNLRERSSAQYGEDWHAGRSE